MKSLALRVRALILAAASCVALGAEATPALDFTGGGTYIAGSFKNEGWSFSLSEARYLTSLGLFDYGGDGFATAHEVGLWNADGSALQASVEISSADPLTASTSAFGDWRFEAVAPVYLAAGTYVIGAHFVDASDIFITADATHSIAISADPVLSFVDNRVTVSPETAFAFPHYVIGASSQFYGGFFGPNLTLATVEEVPEPGSLALLGAGLAGLVALRRRRRG